MSKKIEYRNIDGNIITIQQKNSIGDYNEFIYIDDELKIVHLYWNNKIIEGIYYLSSSENITTILSTLDSTFRWLIMSDKQLINGYDVFKRTWFVDGILSTKYSKVVLNSEWQETAVIGYDENNAIYTGGFKTFS